MGDSITGPYSQYILLDIDTLIPTAPRNYKLQPIPAIIEV